MADMKPLRFVTQERLKSLESAPRDGSETPAYACATCSDLGWLFTDRGAKPCECQKAKRRAKVFDRIPPEYRRFDLASIAPDPKRSEDQAKLIDALREDSGLSLLLSGRVGSGKSLVGWLLYKRAIEQDRPAVALPLAELLGQFRRYECGSDQPPVVTSEDLRSNSRRWLVFLDEFDKARPTEFACEQLFLLMDAVYTYRHQLVVTSNLGKNDLRARWSQASEQYGLSIMRRLLELDGLVYHEMF
jgi:DNA replication protein DnaC